MANLNITNIPAPRVPFIDERTGLMAREWYRFFLNLFVLTGSGNNPVTLDELQLGPPNQPDLTELLIQINQNIAPQYEDQSGDFLATLDTAQLMSMMARFENAEAAIQGAYLQPVVQTGTIASYNLDSGPTAGGVAYGTGPALAVSAAGTVGQVLTSGGAGAPTWATDAGGSVTSVSVVSANGLAGTVATATTTPAITLSTTITGLLKGNGTAISAATSGTDYAPATSGTSILYGNGAGGFSNVTIGTGVSFAAGTLSATGSGGTVTSVAQSFTGGLISVAGSPITTSGTLALTVAGTSGGIPYFSSASTWATSAALAAGSLVQGGGAGVAPSTITTGTGVVTALGVNTGTAGAFVVNGGALGTPSNGTVTNLTGTASININGTVGATTPTTGKFTTLETTGNLGAGTFPSYRLHATGATAGDVIGVIANTSATGFGLKVAAGSSGRYAFLVRDYTDVNNLMVIDGAGGIQGLTGIAVGAATPGASGIAFPATAVAVADVNTLDDYKEGTWTPNQGAGLTVVGAFSSSGTYTKIGRVVNLTGKVAGATSIAATATSLICTNAPFTNGAAVSIGSTMNAAVTVSAGAVMIASSASVYSIEAVAVTTIIYFNMTYHV